MSMYRFAEAYGNPRTGVRFRRAKVTGVPSSNRVTLSLDSSTGATTHTNVNYFGTLPPRDGQSVWAVVVGGEVFCLGSAVDEGGELPAVSVERSTDQTLTTGTNTSVSFNTLVGDDPWGMFPTNPSVDVIIPIRGWYVATATASFAGNAGGTYRFARIQKGTGIMGNQQIVHPTGTVGSANATIINVTAIFQAFAGDDISLVVAHNVGADLLLLSANNSPRLTVAYLGGIAL